MDRRSQPQSGKGSGWSASGVGALWTTGTRAMRAEAVLALMVVAVVAMMIVPLPTWLLDILLSANLSLSVAILLVVLYVPDALGIATFPTILLLTTLFRLALNVSSARLILLQANAGEVIHAFGYFVVRGNYVVGAVVFLILTIIQFVVIAKGAERVAEVGARFVLDAMPGKQMAIDAELRSSAIDGNEARRRRRELARESQFYGAMDGAMKFVKGDVIASLVITAVNILGGLAIGVLQHGMPVTLALKRYGLLTIGDGLVSQIPALVLSTGAGVLVTRVASEEPDTPLGEELWRQLFASPKALFVASGFVALMALTPGLPAIPFALIAVTLFFVARARRDRLSREEREARDAVSAATGIRLQGSLPRGAGEEGHFVPMVIPWSVDVSSDLDALREDAESRNRVFALRETLFAELGVPLPAPRIRVDPVLPPRHVVLSLHEVPARALSVPPDLDDRDASIFIAEEALTLLRARAADFLGLAETQRLLDQLEQIAPATVRNVVPKPVSLPLLADVLRRLLEEGISIRDLRAILESLSSAAATQSDPLQLSEFTRTQLRRAITYRLTRGAPHLEVCLLDTMIEDTVRRAISRTPEGAFLALPPAQARDLIAAIQRALTEAAAPENEERAAAGMAPPRIILTQPDIRRFVRKLVEHDFPELTVVSFAELLPEVTLRPIARATLTGIG
ncbi:flagellar biosynthesis protein FlhA [Pendulispora brunnea]|uniref:Flagellar biosynthesis protein FlhA n=1 Tax=Pendulispora brunnea TaxID=2905690 RepID=A0ABZ2KQF3_9BACT